MSIDNNIKNLTNQNNSIYKGLNAKNIVFTRYEVDYNLTKEEILEILTKENEDLKNLAKNNRPFPQIKEPKKNIEKVNENINEKEESYEDPVKNFSTITNLEDIKRAFFNKEYDQFEKLIKEHNLKYYSASYKYESDKDGVQEFIAKNLLNGFVRSLDNFRKYFIVAFRCYKENDMKYSYPSLWILNSNDELSSIIGSLYDDFIFLEETNIDIFLQNFRKVDKIDKLLDEVYLH
jgi:hypothetical protein